MSVVLVCGGRGYTDLKKMFDTLDAMACEEGTPTRLIAGAADGADTLAVRWAVMRQIPFTEYRADWQRDGKAAGPLRNQRMLDEGKPDLVVAFPGGRGTADMIRRARKAGVRVVEIHA